MAAQHVEYDLKTGKKLDMMLLLGLNEAIDQLAVVNCGAWNRHAWRKDNGRVLRTL